MLKKGLNSAQNLLRIHLDAVGESLVPNESKRKSALMGVGSIIPGLRRTVCVLGISLCLLMALVGCGGEKAKTTPPAVAVSITTPASAQTVPVNGTMAITAAVANTTNNAVTWTVNGVTNGNSTYGTISGSGLTVTYTAPAAVPATATFNITATSQADNTKSASVSVTISAGVVVSMTTPTGPQNVTASSTLSFTASVTGTSNTGVTWTVNGITNGNATYGTITGSGLSVTYTAPAAVPSPATFNVTATSVADTTKSASVSVTILPIVVVSITTPTGAQSLVVNATLGITASVTGTSNTGVTWTVNGVTNGNATYGTITGTGLSVTYTAPAAVPSPATFNVTATSVADTTKSASVSVTITPAPAVVVSITTPTGAQSVAVNGTLAITAAVANTSNTAVTWTVNSITNGNSTYGTIAGSGSSVTYDAPAAVPSPATFNVTATSVADSTKSASVSVTIVAAGACTDTGSESLLSGQYAFILSGYTSSGFLAAVGSFTADGTGKITAGVVDSNGALVQSGASIDPTQSSYSVGSNHLGCATIVTTSGTFTTRLSVGGITSNVATAGRMIEWDSASSATYLTAVGQILKQTVPSNVPSGAYVFENTGVYGSSSENRIGLVGMVTTEAGASGGTITGGEYDVNVEGVINDGNGLSTPYSGITGTYTAPDPTTGRFTDTTTRNSTTNNHVDYLVSGSQFLQLSTDTLASDTAVTVGMSQLQSGSLSLTTGSNLVYYATGTESAELGLINVTGSTSYTATYYEDVAGGPESPQTPSCAYTIDTYGRLVTSGATCTMYLTTYSKMYPPVFYLTGPNTGVMLGTGAGVYIGQVEPQVAPSGGFSATSISGTFYDGDTEVVNEGVSAEMIDVEVLTFDGMGGVDIIGDYIGAYIGTSVTQQADQTTNTSVGTVNSNGTFSTNSTYGQINAIMISTTKAVDIDAAAEANPIISVVKQ